MSIDSFRFYHTTPDRSDYLPIVPHRLNILVSACRMEKYWSGISKHLHLANSTFLDSGGITMLKLAEKGKATAADVASWVRRQDVIPEYASRLEEVGVTSGVAAMMDHPCEPWLLTAAGTTVKDAVSVTIENAAKYREVELPPGWTKVYVAQGWTLDDYGEGMDAYETLGILGDVRDGRAWLAAGTTCMRKPDDGLYSVYEFLRSRLGPRGHMHALGIAQASWVSHMVKNGWVQTADSGTASTSAGLNKEPLRIEGHRHNSCLPFLYASWMLYQEAQILAAVNGETKVKPTNQLTFDALMKEESACQNLA